MNPITKILKTSLTSFARRQRKQKSAKELNKLDLEIKQIKRQIQVLDVLANSLNYCCHLPANHPHYIDWERAEPAINILFNYTLMLDRQSRQVESKIKQLPESVKK
ncbi:hypothetical protein [Lactobacillus crispatus]|uniref:hypothetical protein n=1 Tax=Lactobacillus crispatus TaxID=47770 RepID=UPI001957ADB3|nr:hypothetical protein [Lactobacillus crispatus]MBM6872890.1 hypothetical protein [Lactobacillus crispatus]